VTATVVAIAAGGASGALLRHYVGGAVQRAVSAGPGAGGAGGLAGAAAFPWGTLVVNVLGCFALGALAGYEVRVGAMPPALRMGLVVGFLGGFTTFSSFGLETVRLLHGGEAVRALVYVALSNVVGIGALALGLKLAEGA
jgi:CrcB protein